MVIAKQIIAILCDDVREEIGNKISLMGIYDDNIVLPVLPAVLPKLCIYINMIDVSKDVTAFKVKVSVPGKDSPIEFNIPAQVNHDVPKKNARIMIALSPFKVTKIGEAKIELMVNEEMESLVVHKFSIMTPDQSNQSAGSEKV